MTSSVSPYLQRPVRKLEEVQPEAKPVAPNRSRPIAADTAAAGSSGNEPLPPVTGASPDG